MVPFIDVLVLILNDFVTVCGCGLWETGKNAFVDVLANANTGVSVKGAGKVGVGAEGRGKGNGGLGIHYRGVGKGRRVKAC